jgi:hypothetical protein
MRTFIVGTLGATLGIALFLAGLFTGASIYRANTGYALEQARASVNRESPQMQCIHWVENWRSASNFSKNGDPPTFGMFTDLCGKPGSK